MKNVLQQVPTTPKCCATCMKEKIIKNILARLEALEKEHDWAA